MLSKRDTWRGAFTRFSFAWQDLVIPRFAQGEILSDMDEKGECLGREDNTMNLVDLLRHYVGQFLQSMGGTHTLAQTSTLLLRKPAQAAQPGKAELPTNNNALHCQMPNDLPRVTIYGAPIEHGLRNRRSCRNPSSKTSGFRL
jgi:hypothetical protein